MLKSYLFVATTSEKGRGVYTKQHIPANTIIEVSPVIIMDNADRKHLDKTLLFNYIFEWGTDGKRCCMALGLIPMYNHAYKSNCEYYMDYENDTIIIETQRDIEKGEELSINYNGDCNDAEEIWFDVK